MGWFSSVSGEGLEQYNKWLASYTKPPSDDEEMKVKDLPKGKDFRPYNDDTFFLDVDA